MTQEQQSIQVEEFLVTTGVMPENIWISVEGGEGGAFSMAEFAEVVRKFYEEKF